MTAFTVEWTPSTADVYAASGMGRPMARRLGMVGVAVAVAAAGVWTSAPGVGPVFVVALMLLGPTALAMGLTQQVAELRRRFGRPRRVVFSPAGLLRDDALFVRWSAVALEPRRSRVVLRWGASVLRVPRDRLPPDAEARLRGWMAAPSEEAPPPPEIPDGRSSRFHVDPQDFVEGAARYLERAVPAYPRAAVPAGMAALVGFGACAAWSLWDTAPGLGVAALVPFGVLAALLAPWWRPGRSAVRTLVAATGLPRPAEATLTAGAERWRLVGPSGWLSATWADTEVHRAGDVHVVLKAPVGFVPVPLAAAVPEVLRRVRT